MTQGKYLELSGAQRTDVWRRWKAESRCIRLVGPLTGRIRPFTVYWRITVGLSSGSSALGASAHSG